MRRSDLPVAGKFISGSLVDQQNDSYDAFLRIHEKKRATKKPRNIRNRPSVPATVRRMMFATLGSAEKNVSIRNVRMAPAAKRMNEMSVPLRRVLLQAINDDY